MGVSPSPEPLVSLGDVVVHGRHVRLPLKQLVGGGVLQHLGHGAQVAALVRVQLPAGRHVDDVEAVRRHDGGVHVAVVQQVADDLGGGNAACHSLSSIDGPKQSAYASTYLYGQYTNVRRGKCLHKKVYINIYVT